MIFIFLCKDLFQKGFFLDLLPGIQFNEDQVIVPWEVLRVIQGQCCIFRG